MGIIAISRIAVKLDAKIASNMVTFLLVVPVCFDTYRTS